ncbi:MAG: hypothetical protein ACRC46_07880 [Thermoguttaceae bacterium]
MTKIREWLHDFTFPFYPKWATPEGHAKWYKGCSKVYLHTSRRIRRAKGPL